MTVFGRDVSHDTPTPSLSNVSILIARAAFGHVADVGYTRHITDATAAGKLVGSYQFLEGPERNTTLQAQADTFARVCRTPHFAAVDLENDIYQGRNYGRYGLSALLGYIDLLRARGIDPGVYADRELWTSTFVGMLRAHAVRWFWVPDWTGNPLPDYITKSGTPVAHQYRGDPDYSRFFGTLADWQRVAGLGPPPTGGVKLWPGGNGYPAARFAFRGLYRVRAGHDAHVLSVPHSPDAGFITARIPAGHPLPFRVAQTVVRNRQPLWHGDAAGIRWVAHERVEAIR